jgi:anti-anti-sigma factor
MEELIDLGGAEARLEEVSDASGVLVLKLTGELDLSNVGSFRAAIDATYGHGLDRIVFDLSGLKFMDSSGLAMFIAIAERVETVELRNPQPIIRRIIELTGLSDVLVLTPGGT